ncbi:MAG: RrF2 family transcriptional regulator [Terriglobia bacterium]
MQASLLLALEPEGTLRRVSELADRLGAPATYLAKILQSLTRLGLLRAVRGPGGGMQLARPAREVHLWDVLSAVAPGDQFEDCLLGLGGCSDLRPCPLHEVWAPIRRQILDLLHTKTLWEIATEAERKGVLDWEPRPDAGSRRSHPGRHTSGADARGAFRGREAH